jgi:hypothetical protein
VSEHADKHESERLTIENQIANRPANLFAEAGRADVL